MPSASSEALALHGESPAIDLHADTLMWARWLGYDLHRKHEPPLPRSAIGGHVDLPRMREGGLGAQFFGLVSLPIVSGIGGMARVVDEQIDQLEQAIARGAGSIRLARTPDDIETCRKDGAIAALLGIEGAHALEGDLEQLEHFQARGVRYLGLLHFSANEAGFPAFGRGKRVDGLTRWGRELVRKCEDLRVIVDLAHINRQGFIDVCEMARKPLIVSHTGVLGAFDHWRNIDDEQLRAVAKTGGCIGIIFVPAYVGGDGFEPLVRHFKHILDVVGEDTPALGSDWDGFVVPTRGLGDPRGLPLLTEALLAGGIPERVVRKILRENVLRVLRDA